MSPILSPEPPLSTPLHSLHSLHSHNSTSHLHRHFPHHIPHKPQQPLSPPVTSEEDQDRLRLQLALDQIARLDRDFKDFRTRAGAQLSAVVEENRVLRQRLQHYEKDKENLLQKQQHNGAHAQRNEPHPLHKPQQSQPQPQPQPQRQPRQQHQQLIKPSERMLSVEEMRKREVLRKSITRRSLRPVRGVFAAKDALASDDDVKNGYRRDRRDGGGELGASTAGTKGRIGGGNGSASVNGRRGSLLPRSFSRKWSGCF